MEWLRESVWQLGIAVILILLGAVLLYVSATDEVNATLMWLGLGLVLVAMLIPLASRLYQAAQDEPGEKGET